MGSIHNETSWTLWQSLISRRIRESEESLLEFGDHFPRAHIPNVDTSSEVAESRAEKKTTLRLVKDGVPML